jgi:hypothetical protein
MRLIVRTTLLTCVLGCTDPSSNPKMSTSSNPAKLTKYAYLAADGGPHMFLPAEAASKWKGVSAFRIMDPDTDYGRACAATVNRPMALIAVGRAKAVVFADPPMTAWGVSADGLVEIYVLET